MIQRTLVLGLAVVVFAAAVIANLAILDLITIAELKESLGKTASVIGVTVIATAVIIALAKLASKK